MRRSWLGRGLVTGVVVGAGLLRWWRRRASTADPAEPEAGWWPARAIPAPRTRDAEPEPERAGGTVILGFGRYFAGRADLLTRDGFKAIPPIDGISPFSAVDTPDPDMARFIEAPRTNDRVACDVGKDFAARLALSGADYLVVDNTSALLMHREVNGRLYVVLPNEDTDLMDHLSGSDTVLARARPFRVSRDGLNADLQSRYDAFVDACLAAFDPARIILIRSHIPRFWLADDGTVAPTNANRATAHLLHELDDHFIDRTGCQVSHAVLGHFPTAEKWQAFDHTLRRMIEDDLVEWCTSSAPAASRRPAHPFPHRAMSAADHVVGAVRQQRPVDEKWLHAYFAAGGASYDDMLALVHLEQTDGARHAALIRGCVRRAVVDTTSCLVAETRRHFDRSVHALRGWPWRMTDLPSGDPWVRQIAFTCGRFGFRFFADGTIDTFSAPQVTAAEATDVVNGTVPITALTLGATLGSWPVYFERGRQQVTAAPRVVVPGAADLIDTCYWLDWAWVFDNETVVITTAGDASPSPASGPAARTDLSFIFDPHVRICTVGGGLMDQVTHIALFHDLCAPRGLDYYLDDFRYIWWPSHNGFEASRLAPDLERRRMTRHVSQALLESFRDQVMRTRLPWLFNQSRFWHESGLPEAMVVTRDYPNARRLMEIGPDFPVVVYTRYAEVIDHITTPPGPVTFFTTQHRVAIAEPSAEAIRRVFSYRHLEAAGLPPKIEESAAALRAAPHVAFHIRRGDYLKSHFDTDGWHSGYEHYIDAITHLIDTEFGTNAFNVAVFSDDLAFVEANESAYGLDRVAGTVRYIRGNTHYNAIYDSYLMSLCPVIVGSVGFFAATSSLLADPPSVFIRARPEGVKVNWRRGVEAPETSPTPEQASS